MAGSKSKAMPEPVLEVLDEDATEAHSRREQLINQDVQLPDYRGLFRRRTTAALRKSDEDDGDILRQESELPSELGALFNQF